MPQKSANWERQKLPFPRICTEISEEGINQPPCIGRMLEGCPILGHFPTAYLAATSSTCYQATATTTTRPRDFSSV